MKDIKPRPVDFSSQLNSRDYYKGTSFRWAGTWEVGKLYSNDTFFIDYVSFEGCMWVCIKSHYASDNTKPFKGSPYWQIAVEGQGALAISIKGTVSTVDELPSSADFGDAYFVGYELYV